MSANPRVERSLSWLARYESIVDDPAAFRDALERRPPVDLLVPPGVRDVQTVHRLLEARGVRSTTFDYAPYHLRVDTEDGAGTTPEVLCGYAYPQGVVSSLPALALDPQPGMRIWDACAAPGGKTLLLATLAGGRARVLATEPKTQRAGLLVQILARYAVSSTIVAQHDASSLPAVAAFDGILIDAPCTGEGTFRCPVPRYEPTGEEGLARSAALQRRILARAARLLAPGGTLVYATCAYAPEENEAVVDRFLDSEPGFDVVELPASFPGLPGVTSWRGTSFDSRVALGRRLFAHHTGSWGFFLIKLRKSDDAEPVRTTSGPPLASDPTQFERLTGWARTRFGVPLERFKDEAVIARGRDLWLLTHPTREDGTRAADLDMSRLDVVAPGLRSLREGGNLPRATTSFLRWLSDAIVERRVELTWGEVAEVLQAGRWPSGTLDAGGQVAFMHDGRAISGGFASHGEIRLELPKAWR